MDRWIEPVGQTQYKNSNEAKQQHPEMCMGLSDPNQYREQTHTVWVRIHPTQISMVNKYTCQEFGYLSNPNKYKSNKTTKNIQKKKKKILTTM